MDFHFPYLNDLIFIELLMHIEMLFYKILLNHFFLKKAKLLKEHLLQI